MKISSKPCTLVQDTYPYIPYLLYSNSLVSQAYEKKHHNLGNFCRQKLSKITFHMINFRIVKVCTKFSLMN